MGAGTHQEWYHRVPTAGFRRRSSFVGLFPQMSDRKWLLPLALKSWPYREANSCDGIGDPIRLWIFVFVIGTTVIFGSHLKKTSTCVTIIHLKCTWEEWLLSKLCRISMFFTFNDRTGFGNWCEGVCVVLLVFCVVQCVLVCSCVDRVVMAHDVVDAVGSDGESRKKNEWRTTKCSSGSNPRGDDVRLG